MLKPDLFSEVCVCVCVCVCSDQRVKVYRKKGWTEDKYFKLKLSRWLDLELTRQLRKSNSFFPFIFLLFSL